MAPLDQSRSTDLVLNGSQYAFVQDMSKGQIYVHVGSFKSSLESTDQPVRFRNNEFLPCELQEAIRPFVFVPDGSYVVLANPAKDGGSPQREKTAAAELLYGRTINIPGPARFPLWPGQSEKVLAGHILRSNQYLVARITNGDEATANWTKAVLKPQAATAIVPSAEGDDQSHPPAEGQPAAETKPMEVKQLVTGQRIVIRGTEYSFFIPPTGIEVEQEDGGTYVRDAVTLESLQYCVLLSENGKKRFVYGPDVVFPEPTEVFVREGNGNRGDSRIFRALELNSQMGIHVKVIADYTDGETSHKAGEGLFITGDKQQIYFPRAEHAIVPYRGTEQIHYAVIVPEGEARYVLDKESGRVETEEGPEMLLPNPIKEVIVRRVLTDREASLWYPGNFEVASYNEGMREVERTARASGSNFVDDRMVGDRQRETALGASLDERRFGGDQIERRQGFTPPKSVTLKSKFDGAVTINVWPGYAVQVVSKTGDRKVVEGPDNVVLEYDETLAIFELSTGTPKSDARKTPGVYLRVRGNKVSDQIDAETSDLIGVSVKVSYRVNFEGDKNDWFALDDYVGFMTDHLRSVIRGVVKKVGIEEFINNQVEIVRNAILGASVEGGRPGKRFEENGMRVYDLEVLDVHIRDSNVEQLLVASQKEVVKQTLALQAELRKLDLTKQTEDVKRQIAAETKETQLATVSNAAQVAEKQVEVDEAKLKADQKLQELRDALKEAQLKMEKLAADQEIAIDKAHVDLGIAKLTAETAATVERFKAISPDLAAALQAFGDADLMVKFAEALETIPMGLTEGVGEVMQRVFVGTALEGAMEKHKQRNPASTRIPITDRP